MQDPIPVSRRLQKRFFEAVKFEEALRKACERDPEYLGNASAEPFVDPSDDAEKAFKSYVNKLAHVCDSERGGATVTGAAVLQDVDHVAYVVASNQRPPSALQELEHFIRSLFGLVRGAHPVGLVSGTAFTRILHHILGNNLPRVRYYLNHITREMDFCVANISHMPRQGNDAIDSGELPILEPRGLCENNMLIGGRIERLRTSLAELRELAVRAQHVKSAGEELFIRGECLESHTGDVVYQLTSRVRYSLRRYHYMHKRHPGPRLR